MFIQTGSMLPKLLDEVELELQKGMMIMTKMVLKHEFERMKIG